jgi:hypothetical protein
MLPKSLMLPWASVALCLVSLWGFNEQQYVGFQLTIWGEGDYEKTSSGSLW